MANTQTFRLAFILSTVTLLSSCIYYNGPGGYDGPGWLGRNNDHTIRGSGHVVTEIRPINGVRRVRLDNQGDMTITLGDSESLVVDADDNFMPYILTDVRNGELRIHNDGPGYFRNAQDIHYYLTVKNLDGISLGSTGSVEAPALKADRFDVRLSSTGDISMAGLDAEDVRIDVSSTGDVMLGRLQATTLDVRISSTGHVNIRNGSVSSQRVRITSTGSYEATDLDSKVGEVDLNSTGSAYMTVRDYLEAHLTSTGSLHYQGNPRTDIQRSSTGRVVQVSRR